MTSNQPREWSLERLNAAVDRMMPMAPDAVAS